MLKWCLSGCIHRRFYILVSASLCAPCGAWHASLLSDRFGDIDARQLSSFAHRQGLYTLL